MAEGFARAYGSDILEPLSAGLAPAAIVQPLTRKVMLDKNINIDDIEPKNLVSVDLSKIDLIVNMSQTRLTSIANVEIREWKVDDPIGKPEAVYVRVRDEIEHLVMRLILELRKAAKPIEKAQRPKRLPNRSYSVF
jgi:protein-tyrosine-phosphatase